MITFAPILARWNAVLLPTPAVVVVYVEVRRNRCVCDAGVKLEGFRFSSNTAAPQSAFCPCSFAGEEGGALIHQ